MTDTKTLATQVGELLTERGETVAVAESCTGGLIGSLLTDIPGSSAYFDRSLVTYSNRAKVDLLGVRSKTLDEHGAVSEPTARQMATGVRNSASTDWGVSTTGVAGPGGGTERTPVGTIFIGVSQTATDETERVSQYEFDGNRLENKSQFAGQALSDLIDAVENSK